MAARVEHVVTSGTFDLDGGSWDVDNNVWLVGDDDECVVIDAPHDAEAIADLIGDRQLLAILCTHAHNDHVTVAQALSVRYGAPVRLHPDDEVLWRQTYPDFDFEPLEDGETLSVAGVELTVVHTPGHAPGAVCFYAPALGVLFSGDTLFQGGPGATGRSYSDFGTIIDSLEESVLTLPSDTVVHTGHGADTTIGDEAGSVADWIARGH
ncbi:MBL fold metallo-hydrolase [Jatrophihabitans sp.]|uniref:MBL fold metallo-hydrolase n=1 Tax=Jatrophihabitans sp. TaxID=1932789 RepID=UPI0030C725D9|nr:putative hydrolase [Jatrophihabitans sp.]